MPRAKQPVLQKDVHAPLSDDYPDHDAEMNADDYGQILDAIVALGYGLPWRDAVVQRRAYHREKARGR